MLVEVYHNGKLYNVDAGMASTLVIDFDSLTLLKRSGGIERPVWSAEHNSRRQSPPDIICSPCSLGACRSCTTRRCECSAPYHVAQGSSENKVLPHGATLSPFLERHGYTVEPTPARVAGLNS